MSARQMNPFRRIKFKKVLLLVLSRIGTLGILDRRGRGEGGGGGGGDGIAISTGAVAFHTQRPTG